MSEETVEVYRAMDEHRKERRRLYGRPCPVCVEKLPRACPTILLPGQRCRIHNHRDTRPQEE
jgi:hypothetical protein